MRMASADTGDAYTPDETEYNQFNTDRKLQALQSLCQVLAKFNQKKVHYLFQQRHDADRH